MPYISKAQQERARWLTLVQAVNAIQISEKCDPVNAWGQLRQALADGEIKWKWNGPEPAKTRALREKRESRMRNPTPVRFRQAFKHKRSFWQNARAKLDAPGAVVDDDGVHSMPADRNDMLREILLLGIDVKRVWASSGPRPSLTSPKNDLPKAKSASAAVIRRACTAVYNDAKQNGVKPPNMHEAWLQVRPLVPGASRKMVRAVLAESEFANQRLGAGERYKLDSKRT